MTSPTRYRKGKLKLMDHDLSTLAYRHGTPLYVYSSERILDRLHLLQESFSLPVQVHYAMKANSFPPLLRLLSKNKIGADVVSGGEIRRALECGFKGSQIIFSGVGKSRDEIEFALRNKVFCLNVESPQELERIGRIALKMKKKTAVSFRLNPNVNPKTHPYITTGFRENKFGMDRSFLPELLNIARKYKAVLELTGLAFHIGSQILEISPLEEALIKSVPIYKELQAQGFPLTHFDIGGGIGISYSGQKAMNMSSYARAMERHLKPLGCKIICEPGRFLVGDSGVLLTRIEYVKTTPYKRFVIVDTGMHHLIRPALYGSSHRIWPLEKKRGRSLKADVVGPICESGDYLAKNIAMVNPLQDDFLAICDAGAYGFVMASDYNLRGKPLEILI